MEMPALAVSMNFNINCKFLETSGGSRNFCVCIIMLTVCLFSLVSMIDMTKEVAGAT
jgi:hypothetical protein